jgi:hypothetical protein
MKHLFFEVDLFDDCTGSISKICVGDHVCKGMRFYYVISFVHSRQDARMSQDILKKSEEGYQVNTIK